MYKIKFSNGSTKEFKTLQRANLYGANLKEMDLSGANLKGAYLKEVDLAGANLAGVDLDRANLYRANLYKANLEGANLYSATLVGANLEKANLKEVNFEEAVLYRANLKETDLSKAYLKEADLEGADLYRTNVITFSFGKHFGFAHFGNQYKEGSLIKIGCISNNVDWWLENYKKIGKEEEYTDKEIELYGNYLHFLQTNRSSICIQSNF